MAERSYNGRVLNTNPTMAGVGSTTTVNSWIGNSSQGWGVVQTSSGAISVCEYTNYLNEDCIRLSVTGLSRAGGVIGQLGISNTSAYPAPTLSLSVLSGIVESVQPGKQYKLSARYFISALAADTGSMRFAVSRTWYDSNGTRLATTDSTPDTTVSTTWETYEETVTAPARAAYLIIRANLLPHVDPTTNGSATIYVSDFRVTEVLPARTTATSRTTASNRVAVRDMGTALRFDGVDDYVAASAIAAIKQGNPITISMWFNISDDGDGTLFANRIGTTTQNLHFGYRSSARRIEGAFFTAGTPNLYYGRFASPRLALAKWYHFVLVYDGTTLNEGTNGTDHYINGVLQNRASSNFGGAGNVDGLSFGAQTNGANYFKGIIDEPRIWNRALTADEIQKLYLYNIVPQDGLVAEYLFDEASGTTAIDSSGNGNDGVINGCTYTTDVPLVPRTAV